jgi:hypothetical protein
MKFKLVPVLLLLLLVASCSSTVTVKPAPGNQLALSFTLRGELSPTNRYVILLNTSGSAMQVPSLNTANVPFRIPADTISSPYSRSDYDSYFNTWTDFVILEGGQFKLYSGPMNTITQSSVPDLIWSGPTNGKTVSLDINLSYLSNPLPTTIAFDIVSSTTSGDPLDELKATETILNQLDQTKTGNDADEGLDPSIEILSWAVLVK